LTIGPIIDDILLIEVIKVGRRQGPEFYKDLGERFGAGYPFWKGKEPFHMTKRYCSV